MTSMLILSLTTVIFGLAALVVSSRARRRLSEGSLRTYINYFSVCLVFIVIFSIWQTLRNIYDWEVRLKGFSDYPEYIFIILAYIGFIIASYKVVSLSHEFGFKEDGKSIAEIVAKAGGKGQSEKIQRGKKQAKK